MSDTLRDLQTEVTAWADSVYPGRSFNSIVLKLEEELQEIKDSGYADPEEYADTLILLLDLASAYDIDIAAAVRAKIEKNKTRVWIVDPATEIMRHIEDGHVDTE